MSLAQSVVVDALQASNVNHKKTFEKCDLHSAVCCFLESFLNEALERNELFKSTIVQAATSDTMIFRTGKAVVTQLAV